MKTLGFIIAALLLQSTQLIADKHDHKKRHKQAHVHGSGKLELVLEKNLLQVELKIPAHDIVGFEHQATTDKQKNSLIKATKKLEQSSAVLSLTPEAQCAQKQKGQVKSSLLEKIKNEKLAEHHEHEHENEHSDHSEFHLLYKYECKKPEKLDSIEILVFKVFPAIDSLAAVGIKEDQQFSQKLTNRSAIFQLSK